MLASVIRRVRRGAYWGTRQALDARELALNFLPFGASENGHVSALIRRNGRFFQRTELESLEDCAGHTGTVRFFGSAVHQSQQWTHGANNSRLT